MPQRFDMKRFHTITDGDVELGKELIALLGQTLTRTVDVMRQSKAGSSAFKEAAHELKGAADNLGLIDIAELADALEKLPEGADAAQKLDEMAAMLEALHQRAVEEGLV